MRVATRPAPSAAPARAPRDLLRLMTCGSVDDGKSTLIGRLLLDSGSVPDDQVAALAHESRRYGSNGGEPDPALLLDGLESEREQGITIDVAHRYFSTERRAFVIADAPGHEQHTRNMVTAASTSSLAVLVIDAARGSTVQTRRHATLASLLGIRHLVAVVNKMDLVGWDEAVVRAIESELRSFAARLPGGGGHLRVVPVSALHGGNVAGRCAEAPWYVGPPLLELLETIDVPSRAELGELRFPVQYVNRPHAGFRGYAGSLVAGAVRVGDEVLVLPDRARTRVAGIVGPDGPLEEAAAPAPVTLTLDGDVDVVRGDVVVHPAHAASVGTRFEADLVWMHEEPLAPGRQYDLRIATRTVPAVVRAVRHRLDVASLDREDADALALNEIGRCEVALAERAAFDPYDLLPATGGFVLVDRASAATVGAGMIRATPRRRGRRASPDVTWADTRVTRAERAAQKGQRPCAVWFTGLSGAGKTTIANALESRLLELGYHTYLLDGDNVRHGLNRDLGFGDDDRVENVRRIGEVTRLFVDAGLIVLSAFISPFRSDRRMVRDLLGDGEFVEVFVDTPLEVAEARDPKGLYARARRGEIAHFTGIDSPYERPIDPEVRIDTTVMGVEDAVELLLDRLGIPADAP